MDSRIRHEGPLSYPLLCGRLGSNVSTLGQAMHNAAFRSLHLPYVYVSFTTDDTAAGIQALRVLGFRGFSLTIPHKERALQFVDFLGAEAQAIGAINTLINENGILKGENTDWYGVVQALQEKGFSGPQKKAFIFGAGGAARATVFALQRMNVDRIFIASRTNERASALAAEFGATGIPYEDLASFHLAAVDLFVNATPAGSASSGDPVSAPYPFALNVFHEKQFILDMVTEETKLLQEAGKRGAQTVPGIRMLLHQALLQFEHFTGVKAPKSVMEEALAKELAKSRP